MSSVTDLVTRDVIVELAKPAQVKNGEALADAGMVELEQLDPLEVSARVKGLTSGAVTRRTSLSADGAHLNWRCTCTKNERNFCKHLVATAIAVQRKTA